MQEDLGGLVVRDADWTKRLVFWASLAATLFLCVWYRLDIILLAFAGALLAIILHACADWLDRHTPRAITHRLSYAAIVLGICLLACLIGYWIIPSAISEINQIADIIKRDAPNRRVTVEGHASRESAAQEAYNQRLSERRASTVAGALEQNGVNGKNVSAQGLGTRAPVASNDTESGRQQNRRVEVIIEN